ncbi:MAG: hypothetical protein EXR98_06070 [Gemmataceae bacterium]|nr:hypothetical protein [Gemmataceae bacterium]
MLRKIAVVCPALLLAFPWMLVAVQPSPPPLDVQALRQKPITTAGGKVGELLKLWWKESTAAGNAGDFYDNRDGDHSPLSLAPWPQMSAFQYSAEDIKFKRHWAAARVVRPHVTFGNSSTSAPAHLGGSNPRHNYVGQFGLSLLYDQYRGNNLYIYPEHRDHDPGHNGLLLPSPFGRGVGGEGGHGDMYPTNTPYLLISQGSSGSDQPFMRMMPYVLAAFSPEVKKKLIETGTLMPTIQMLFRSTNKHLKDPKEYLTGKAHPSVFEGSWVDELAMVQKAHALELKSLPPMVQLRVLEDDKAINGIDYFDTHPSEVIGTTPACIARVHRSKAHKQRLVVDAGASFDVNKAKLTYTWVVLRGDPDKIKIVPKKDDQSVAEITVAWHDRRPVSPGSPLESNRVDIGVFVHNGTHYSAPGFVTFHTLDREARVYSRDGKILSVAHGMGDADVRVTNWEKLFSQLAKDNTAARLLGISKEQQVALGEMAALLLDVNQQILQIRSQIQKGEKAIKDSKDEKQKQQVKKLMDQGNQLIVKAQMFFEKALDTTEKTLDDSPRHFFETRFAKLTQDPLFTQNQADWLKKNRTPANEARIKSLWQKMSRLGIANDKEVLTPLLPGATLEKATWTAFERSQLEWLHASLLAELAFPGALTESYQVNYVDHRLSAPREWRDFQRYDLKGEWIGWMRYGTDVPQIFNHEGLLAVDRDLRGCVVKGRTVRYVQDPPKGKGINPNPLRLVLGDTIIRYEFDGKDDWRGRRAGMETIK